MTPNSRYDIDSVVDQYQTLIEDLHEGSRWIVADSARDAVVQPKANLQAHRGLNTIDRFSHGTAGSDVAASIGATAPTALGADWALQRQSGNVESARLAGVSAGDLPAANTAPTLSISTMPAANYEIEYNNDRTFATKFTAAAIGNLSGPGDVDWFAVRLEATGMQTVSFDTSPLSTGLWNVVWYGPGMQVLSDRILGPSAGTGTTSYEIPADSAGVYYLKVQPNDPGLFNSGLYTASIGALDHLTYTDTEADDTFGIKTGRLIGNDVDPGTTLTYGISGGVDHGATMSLAGSFGTLTVTRTTGSFIYVPNDAAIEALKAAASEAFMMTVSDGLATTSSPYELRLAGADDPTSFGGATTGTVSEDGTTTTGGVLDVSDRDPGDVAIDAQVNTVGVFGSFNIDAMGNWTYRLNNGAVNVQSLVAGQSMTETFAVSTSGGATQDILVTVNGTDDVLIGTSGAETLTGSLITDQIFGLAGNDTLLGLGNNDTLDGGPGIDIAQYAGLREHFQLTRSVSGDWTVQDRLGDEGTDGLHDIERLRFSDLKIALDLNPNENAGRALEFLGVLAPELISAPSVVGAILNLADQGSGLQGLFQLALDLGLVSQIAGAGTNTAVAQMAFRNVIGAQPDAMTTDRLLSFMDGRVASFSQAEFLTAIASLEVNQDHIGLVGLQQTGIEYL